MLTPKTKTFLVALLLLFAAACQGGIPDLPEQDPDWCYTLNFTSSSYGATITSGSWINGVGIQSSGGNLNATYTHTGYVTPAAAIAIIQIDHSSDSSFTAAVNLFGITGNYSDTIPSFISTYELPFVPTTAGVNNNRASINISTSATSVTISSLTVTGFGSNPFPSNSCAATPTETASPQPLPSLTASNTPTPTSTSTSTLTPTATVPSSSEYDWCYEFNFRITDGGFEKDPARPRGNWVSGTGWEYEDGLYNTSAQRGIYIQRSITNNDATLHRLELDYTLTKGTYTNTFQSAFGVYRATLSSPYFSLTAAQVTANIPNGSDTYVYTNAGIDMLSALYIQFASSKDESSPYEYSGYVAVHAMRLYGMHTNPFPSSNCGVFTPPTDTPTPTSTITNTPAPTATVDLTQTTATPGPSPTGTPPYEERCNFVNFSFNQGLFGWATDGLQSTGSVILADGESIAQTVNLADAGIYYLTVVTSIDDTGAFDNDGDVALDYLIIEPDLNLISDTYNAVPEEYFRMQGNEIRFTEPFTLQAGTNDITLQANLSNVNSIKILEACLSEFDPDDDNDFDDNDNTGNYGWKTCADVIDRPTSVIQIGGWIQYLWNSTDQKIQCVLMPTLHNVTNTVIAFAGWTYQTALGFFLWTGGKLIPFLTGHLSNLFRALWALVTGGFGGLFDFLFNWDELLIVRAIGIKATNIITGYTGAGRAYLNVGELQIGNLVAFYNGTPSTPPPGLPDCINQPFEYDLCAVHWVVENTLLFGPVGMLIIPVLTIFVDLVIAMYFSNTIRKFIRNLLELFND